MTTPFYSRENLFRNAFFFSVLFHGVLAGGLYLGKMRQGNVVSPSIEIDLTKPFRIGGNPLLKPGGGTSLKAPEKVGVPTVSEIAGPAAPAAKEKEWVLPGPKTEEVEKPVPVGTPSSENLKANEFGPEGQGIPGTGGGWGGGEGEGGGIPLSRFPKLLNRSEILKLLRKMYPVAERESGQEGMVAVDLHLGVDGQVHAVTVVDSAGESFDSVAKIVAKKMRFSPAMVQETPVSVKIRQSIVFQLEGN